MRLHFLFTYAAAAATATLAAAESGNGSPVVVGYFPMWKSALLEPADFSKYTHVNLGFAIPKSDGTLEFKDGTEIIPKAVKKIHGGNAKSLMSVGGWSGSNLLSTILKDTSKKESLINSIKECVKTHGLTGIDIDWEYPGRLGNTCNVFDPQTDTKNFLKFLQDLRKIFDSEFGKGKKLITLAVRVQPFDGPNGPVADVSEFAKVVDFANLMQYDLNGGWSNTTGPNAPFNFEKGKGAQLSFVSAIDEWTKAGWPAGQLTAGLAFYGHATTALVDMSKDSKNQYQAQSNVIPKGDSDDALWADECADTNTLSGTWKWANMRKEGLLDNPTTAKEPWTRYWDDVSKTPWLFNKNTKVFISYDDTESIKIKVDYAASKGLAGAMVWSTEMDYNNELIDVIHSWGKGNSSSSDNYVSSVPNSSGSEETPTLSGAAYTEKEVSSTLPDQGSDLDECESAFDTTKAGEKSDEPASSQETLKDSEYTTDATPNQSTPQASNQSSGIKSKEPATYVTPTTIIDENSNISTGEASDKYSSSSAEMLTESSAEPSGDKYSTDEGNIISSAVNNGDNGSCNSHGMKKCSGKDGKGKTYLTCLYDKWITQSCGEGTFCVQNGQSIRCDII